MMNTYENGCYPRDYKGAYQDVTSKLCIRLQKG